MQSISRCFRRAGPALALALAAAGAFSGGAASAGAAKAPASCAIEVSRGSGAITLTALARADAAVGGQYAFRVSGAGTDIRQGGAFQAAPGRAATLGTVALDAAGGPYDVDLDLTVEGKTISCTKRIGGGI